MPLYLERSQARKRFKEILGHANHLLITILVGLDAIEKGGIKEPPKELHAAWNPLDPTASARRSRQMVLEMALVRAVDALDAYISWSRQKPALIQDVVLQEAIDQCGRSVSKKFRAMYTHYDSIDPVIITLTEVVIAWRNKSVHFIADDDISAKQWRLLDKNSERISSDFCGLEVSRLLQDFEKNKPPTFKETASLIQATHRVVDFLEAAQFGALNATLFLRQLIWTGLGGEDLDHDKKVLQKKKTIASIWGRDISDRRNAIISYLVNLGLSPSKAFGHSVEIDDDLIDSLSDMTPKEAFSYISFQPEL